jgi:hypothetical protein
MTGGAHQTFDTALQFTQRQDPLSLPRPELGCHGEPDGDIGSWTKTRRWRWWRGPDAMAHRARGVFLPGRARASRCGSGMALLHATLCRGPGPGAKHGTPVQTRRQVTAPATALTAMKSRSFEYCYSITLVARRSTDWGIVMPRALAVLRLITSSNCVGCSIGRSAGLVPLRIRWTYTAAWRN